MDIKKIKEFLWCTKQDEIGEWVVKRYRQKIIYICIGIIVALIFSISISYSCQWQDLTKNADKYVDVYYSDYYGDYEVELDFINYDDYEIDIYFFDVNGSYLGDYQGDGLFTYIVFEKQPTYYEINSLYRNNFAAEMFLIIFIYLSIALVPCCIGWIFSAFFQSIYKEYNDNSNKIVCISKGTKHELYINNHLVDTENSKMLGFNSKILSAKVNDDEYVAKVGGTWRRELTLYKNNELIK